MSEIEKLVNAVCNEWWSNALYDESETAARAALLSRIAEVETERKQLRFKTSEQERFIWWIHQVYARNVQDLIAEIMAACTYQDEATAASGKYGLPIKCFEHMERLRKYSHGIYDGTYLDAQVSTDVTWLENECNTGLKNMIVCHECRVVLPPQMERYQYNYCPSCGRRIERKNSNEASDIEVSVTENVLTDIKTAQSNEMENPKMTLKVTADPYVEIFYSHIKDLNTAIDKLGPLVARAITKITPPSIGRENTADFELARTMRNALDELTEVQNREYRDPNSQELLDTSKGEN